MARRFVFVFAFAASLLGIAVPAFACGGLIGPRGSVNLLRTTTVAAYHDGIEHYITSFTFTGAGGGKFGSIVPLPGIPTKVERGGSWTLQRLEREVTPVREVFADALSFGAVPARASAQVILQTRIDALDITVLKGGASEVGVWAQDNGFDLPPDAPQVLDFYARRSQIFMAARFNLQVAQARGAQAGDGTPIHLTIPTKNPWVPLRILALGKQSSETIEADVFLLTDRTPTLLPAPENNGREGAPVANGMIQNNSQAASTSLLDDLRSDKGMKWVPASMWLTFLKLDTSAQTMGYDLAIDASGAAAPSWVDAGFVGLRDAARTGGRGLLIAAIAALALAGITLVLKARTTVSV